MNSSTVVKSLCTCLKAALYCTSNLEQVAVYLFAEVSLFVSYCFKPSQPQRIISWLKETFIKRYHLIYPLTARVVGAPQMISQPVSSIFPCSPLPWDLANSRPVHSLMLSSHLFLCLPCLLHPFTVPCKMVLDRPDERETGPHHCSLRLFTVVRPSYGPIACWFLAQTFSLATWSLYEMCSILQ